MTDEIDKEDVAKEIAHFQGISKSDKIEPVDVEITYNKKTGEILGIGNATKDQIKVTLHPKKSDLKQDPQLKGIEAWGTTQLQITYHKLSGKILKVEEVKEDDPDE